MQHVTLEQLRNSNPEIVAKINDLFGGKTDNIQFAIGSLDDLAAPVVPQEDPSFGNLIDNILPEVANDLTEVIDLLKIARKLVRTERKALKAVSAETLDALPKQDRVSFAKDMLGTYEDVTSLVSDALTILDKSGYAIIENDDQPAETEHTGDEECPACKLEEAAARAEMAAGVKRAQDALKSKVIEEAKGVVEVHVQSVDVMYQASIEQQNVLLNLNEDIVNLRSLPNPSPEDYSRVLLAAREAQKKYSTINTEKDAALLKIAKTAAPAAFAS